MAEETKKKTRRPKRPRRKAAGENRCGQAGESKAGKPAAGACRGAVADAPKPAEMLRRAPPPPTAAELLGEDVNAKKIIKAKHAKNITRWHRQHPGHFQQHPGDDHRHARQPASAGRPPGAWVSKVRARARPTRRNRSPRTPPARRWRMACRKLKSASKDRAPVANPPFAPCRPSVWKSPPSRT